MVGTPIRSINLRQHLLVLTPARLLGKVLLLRQLRRALLRPAGRVGL